MSDDALEEALRTEVIRIMLKHPYERRPDGCTGEAMATGSDLTVSDNYRFSRFSLPSPWMTKKVFSSLSPTLPLNVSGCHQDV